MELVYLYHSGFAILSHRLTLIFDFYEDSESETRGVLHDDLLQRDGAIYVFSTHSHADHFNPEILRWREIRPDIQYVLSADIRKHHRVDFPVVWVDKGDSWNDGTLRVSAFGSTDIGISIVVETDGMRIFHAGDLNNWHWMEECDEQEWRGYERAFLAELGDLYRMYKELDIVMFPVDPRLGSEYMRGPRQFVEQISTGLFIPMHFDAEVQKAQAFQTIAESYGTRFVCPKRRGEYINIDKLFSTKEV